MDEVAMWRAAFPGARLTYIQVGNLEVGTPPADGWKVDDNLSRLVHSQQPKAPEQIVAKVAAKQRSAKVAKMRKAT